MHAARSHGAALGSACNRSDDTRLIPAFKNAPTARFRAFASTAAASSTKGTTIKKGFTADLAPNRAGGGRLTRYRPMRFKQKLTRAELQAIQGRNDSEDVKTLLWEIARLRALALRADQLQASLGNLAGGPGLILSALRAELKNDPCIDEQVKLDLGRPG